MPPKKFPQTCNLLISQTTMQRHFSPTLHPTSPIIFATATEVAFVLLRISWFNCHCCTEHEATPTQKLAQKWCCSLSQFLRERLQRSFTRTNQLHWTTQYTRHFPYIIHFSLIHFSSSKLYTTGQEFPCQSWYSNSRESKIVVYIKNVSSYQNYWFLKLLE